MQKRGNFDNEVMRIQETKKRKEFDKVKDGAATAKVLQRKTLRKRTAFGD